MSDTAPHDVDAEAAVLSYVFLHGDATRAMAVGDMLRPEEMYSEAHRRIFEAVLATAASGAPVDAVTVAGRLRDTGRFEQAGGAAYITEVIDAAPHVSDDAIRAYAGTVRRHAQMRQLLATMQRACAQIYQGVDEPEAFLGELECAVSAIATSASKRRAGLEPIKDVLVRMAQRMKRQAQGETAGIQTGILSFDRLTGGIHDGDLSIVAGRPGMGKSSLVMNIVDGVSSRVDSEGRRQASLVFSLEMPSEQLAARMVASRARTDVSSMRNGRVGNRIRDVVLATNDLAALPVFVDETPRPTVEDIRAKARAKAAELARDGVRLALVAIDYLQIMNIPMQRGQTEASAIGHVTSTLKGLAKELSCPVVCLSQLNRELEKRQDKRPLMADLRASGAIEQDADNIFFVFREGYYVDKSSSGPAEIIIAKQRNGPTGVAEVHWDGSTCTFTSAADSEERAA